MTTLTILIAGLILSCTSVLKAQQATSNSWVNDTVPSTAWTAHRLPGGSQSQATVFTVDHRLYWKYRIPVAYGKTPSDAVINKRPVQTFYIGPRSTRRSAITDIMLLRGIQLPGTRTIPAWKEWLLPPMTPSGLDHQWTREPASPRLDLIVFRF